MTPLVLVGLAAACGLLLVGGGLGWIPFDLMGSRWGVAWRRGAPGPAAAGRRHPPDRIRLFLLALVAAGLAFAITHWLMSVPMAVLGVIGMQGLTSGSAKRAITKLEAIATWTEMLRDTLAGASGLNQAIMATGGIAPAPIADEVRNLASRVAAGLPLATALVLFGEELDDPSADTVVACLVLAAKERAQRLAELLTAMADVTREEVSMRMSVESSRASGLTAVRSVTGFSIGFFVLMAVFARSYMQPYGSSVGQMVLGLVGCIFGLGLWLMAAMVRPSPFSRLHCDMSEGS